MASSNDLPGLNCPAECCDDPAHCPLRPACAQRADIQALIEADHDVSIRDGVVTSVPADHSYR